MHGSPSHTMAEFTGPVPAAPNIWRWEMTRGQDRGVSKDVLRTILTHGA